jgi:zinc protease
MQHQELTLKNNLKTLFVHSPGSTAATVQIWFRAGSSLETIDNEGIAHFLEHMFFKGTSTRPGAKIAHEVETFGGEINAFTSFDYTCYYINTPMPCLQKSVEILLDMVSNPEFKNDDLLPERGVVFEEYRRSIDNPNQFAFSKLQASTFQGSYAHPILGREDTIKNFSREQLISFRKNHYNLSNALLVVAGDLSNRDEMISLIETFNLPAGEESSFENFTLKTHSTIDVHQKDVGMTTLTLTLQAPEYSSHASVSEDLAMNCLGYGETSRLYEALVLDKTLANHASASTMFMIKGGAHFIRLSFPFKNLAPLMKKFSAVINDTIENGLEANEVTKIKNQYISSKIYEQESIEAFTFSLGHGFAQTGDINCEEEFIKKMKKVNPSEVNKSLKQIFSKNIHMCLQIPTKESLPLAKKELQKLQVDLVKIKEKIKKEAQDNYKITLSKHDPQVKLLKLASGISLIYRQNLMTPTFVLQAYMRGGLTEENKKINGTYGMLGSLLTKGYGKVSYETIRQDLEEKSSGLSGFSGKNAYGLLMHGLSEHFHTLSSHFVGSFLKPTFPAKILMHEKQLTLRSLISQKEDPVKQCFKEAQRLFFGEHPYSLQQMGTPETIKTISSKSLNTLHSKNLKSKEILINYCGDADLSEVLSALAPVMEELKARKSTPVVYKKYKAQTNVEKFISFNREQTQILYGIPCGKMGSPENLYLKMLSSHLSGQSSELFVEVRDRQGLCYSAQPIHHTALEGGYFGIYMASGHDKVTAAIAAIKLLINKIKTNGLSEEDFLRIKSMIKGQNLLNIQTNEDFASIYAVPVLQAQSLDYYYNSNKEIEELEYADFQKNIKKALSGKWNTIVVGREVGANNLI